MTRKERLHSLKTSAERVGLRLHVWSPGDGVSRYYFSRGDSVVLSALGLSEAETALGAYISGYTAERRPK